jgi:hypothetical protein
VLRRATGKEHFRIEAESSGRLFHRSSDVFGADSKAIHIRPVEARDIDGRADVAGQHPAATQAE